MKPDREQKSFLQRMEHLVRREPKGALRIDVTERELPLVTDAYGALLFEGWLYGMEAPHGNETFGVGPSVRHVMTHDFARTLHRQIDTRIHPGPLSKQEVRLFLGDHPTRTEQARLIYERLMEVEEEGFRDAMVSGKDRPRCRLLTAPHPDRALRKKGVQRAAFFGPQYPWPQPAVTVTSPKGKGTREWATTSARDLQCLRGPRFHVATECINGRWVCHVWRGEDWLTLRTAVFYPAEVAQSIGELIEIPSVVDPVAAIQKTMREHMRTIASAGGKATAHYTDAEVAQAFADYKSRTKGKRAWDAANALIRKGQPLDKWKHPNSAWNRVKRIAKAQGKSVTPDDWFANL